MRNWLFFICIAFIFVSCSVQKRNFQPGYYVSWKKGAPSVARADHGATELPRFNKEEARRITEVTASSLTQKESSDQRPVPVFTGTKTYIDNCDTLFFRNGMVVKAKITEIGITEVKYRYCNNPDGPILVAKKDDIASVAYSNGDKDVFTVAPNPRREAGWSKQDEVTRAKGMASDALILGIYSIPGLFIYFSGFITAFIAIRRGENALVVLERDPLGNMTSIRKAKTGILLGRIALGIVLLGLIFLIAVIYHFI